MVIEFEKLLAHKIKFIIAGARVSMLHLMISDAFRRLNILDKSEKATPELCAIYKQNDASQ